MHKKIKLLLSFFLLFNTFLFSKNLELEKIFKENKVNGTIVIESLQKQTKYIYNDKRANTFFSPASTFKIPNTLIALNEELVNKDSIILWDKQIREYETVNSLEFTPVSALTANAIKGEKEKYRNCGCCALFVPYAVR